jgi:hypothetical protein
MRGIFFGVLLATTSAAITWASAPQCPSLPVRSVHKNIVSSAENPQIRIAVDPSFTYVGRLELLEANICADRFVFAAVASNKVERLFIVQFEALAAGATRGYEERITNRVHLAGDDYQNDVIPYSERKIIQEDPNGASAKTAALLKTHGCQFDDERIVSRYSRVVDTERHHRLVLLYAEPLGGTGIAPSDLNGRRRTPRVDQAAGSVIARSLKTFKILPEKP